MVLASAYFPSDEQTTITELLRAHFPESTAERRDTRASGGSAHVPKWRQANEIFTPGRVEDAVNSFGSYKSPGVDGICPALLQRGDLTQ